MKWHAIDKRRGGRIARIVLSALLVLTGVGPAHAGSVARAKRLFGQAEAQYAAGEYARAAQLYQAAYAEKPLPGFLFNLGQCYRKQGDCRRAIEHYQRYLSESKAPPHREATEKLIERCKRELADAEPAPVEAPPPVAAKPVAVAPSAAAPAAQSDSLRLHPVYFWSTLGVTGALLITSIATGAAALSKSADFKDQATPFDQLQGLKDSGEGLRTASTVTFALGLTAATAALVLYFWTDFGGEQAKVAAAPVSGGGLVVLGGSF